MSAPHNQWSQGLRPLVPWQFQAGRGRGRLVEKNCRVYNKFMRISQAEKRLDATHLLESLVVSKIFNEIFNDDVHVLLNL